MQLQIYDCNAGGTQIWKLPPGPLTGPAALCADVAFPTGALTVRTNPDEHKSYDWNSAGIENGA